MFLQNIFVLQRHSANVARHFLWPPSLRLEVFLLHSRRPRNSQVQVLAQPIKVKKDAGFHNKYRNGYKYYLLP
jgi:hypothetical protein